MKSLFAALAITLSMSAFADSGTEAQSLSGISAEEAAATQKVIAERRAERQAKREAAETANHAAKSTPATAPAPTKS
jgi:hypothetical protein